MVQTRFRLGHPFVRGVICGVILVVLGRWFVNETSLADHLVAPLLLDDSPSGGDAIVVLGGGTVGACAPNLNSMRRIVLAARLFREGRAPWLAISGGTPDANCPVADSMMNLAADLGVPDKSMIVERRALSTHENAQLSAPLLRAANVRRVVLVTDRLHMRRSRAVFEREGFAVAPVSVPIYEGHIDNVSMLAAGLREVAALAYYAMRGWIAMTQNGASPPPSQATEPDATRSAADGEAMPSAPLVILGASYAGNWKISAFGAVPVVNAGIAGQRSFEMLARFDQDVVAQRPRAVLLWGFINDLFSSDNFDQTSERVRETYRELISRSRAAAIEPILATEITVRSPGGLTNSARAAIGRLLGKVSYQDQINRHVMALNQWIKEQGRTEGLLVVDLQSVLADAQGGRRREFATDDGSHVTASGYDALTQSVGPILSRHFHADKPKRD
jgi:uncharacterized SAM-binding protein YcdF (DUF218 family)/lysophospholipase L1-like esterase